MNVQALAQHYNRVIWFSDRLLGCCYAVFRVFCDIVFCALLESFGFLLGCSGWLPGCCLNLSDGYNGILDGCQGFAM